MNKPVLYSPGICYSTHTLEKWELQDALVVVRELQKVITKVGWSVCLHGSVLYKGASDKDLDLLLFPHNSSLADIQALYTALKGFAMKQCLTKEEVHNEWRKIGSTDTKWVEIWKYGNKRIDLFIWI